MKVIAFVGMPGAGKSEASAVAREMGMPVVIMGDVLREEVRERGLPPTDVNTGAVANQLRKDEGMDAIAKRCMPKIEALKANDVVVGKIDGPCELRLDRLRRRARSDDEGSPEWLKQRDERELFWGMGKAIDVAGKSVVNLDPIERFKAEIRSILRKEGITTTVSVLLFPTEVEERVRKAVESVFPGARLTLIKKEGYVDR